MKKLICCAQHLLNKTRCLDFLGPVALRLYLVPIFWMAGTTKIASIDNVAAWFQHSLHLPFPVVMAHLAAWTEVVGAVCLLAGFAVRWVTIPMMVTMLVAIFKVHWDKGWSAIGTHGMEGVIRLSSFLSWLKETHPDRYQHITELGKPVLLNNGVEFAVTYFIMLLVLFFIGGGNYLSIDYWIKRCCCKE